MPKVSKNSATQGGDFGPVEDRSDQLEGYTVNFTSFREDIDATPLMKGLPDDRCQCPHWGYVVNGKMTFRYADGEEVFEAGDAFRIRHRIERNRPMLLFVGQTLVSKDGSLHYISDHADILWKVPLYLSFLLRGRRSGWERTERADSMS